MSRVLLIGDISRDVFLAVDCHKLSPESPVPIVEPHSVSENAGMAGNVLANLRSLDPTLVVGGLFPKQPSIKTRYVDRKTNHHFIRVDQNVVSEPMTGMDFLSAVKALPDAIVLSDYSKGFLTMDAMQSVSRFCATNLVPLFADTKATLGPWSKDITFVKINEVEFEANLKAGVKPWEHCQNLIVTRGGEGMDIYNEDGQVAYHSYGIEAEVADVVGAGDTTLAALVVNYLKTGDIKQAMDYANRAAAVAVSKRGVVAVKAEEVG